jgi:hypothetical protein
MAKRKKDKRTNNDLQIIHIKLKSRNPNPTKIGGELRCSGRVSFMKSPHIISDSFYG